jgi:hypothetical protein
MANTNRIPNGSYTPADILRLARELDVPGALVSRGRKLETRSYAVELSDGGTLGWKVTALPEQHYTGTV